MIWKYLLACVSPKGKAEVVFDFKPVWGKMA